MKVHARFRAILKTNDFRTESRHVEEQIQETSISSGDDRDFIENENVQR